MSEKRVLVVRSGQRAFSEWGEQPAAQIIERESHVVETAVVRVDALRSPFHLALFTSQIAVDRLVAQRELMEAFRSGLPGARVAAVGPGTAGALQRQGIAPGLVAASSAESILAALPESLQGWRVVWPCAEDASDALQRELTRRGAAVERLVLYRKRPRAADPDLSREVLASPLAAFCITSPAAGEWLLAQMPGEAIGALQAAPAVVLGPSSRRFLEGRGFTDVRTCSPGTYAGAAALLARLAAGRGTE
ncbi:MAG: uroporphyrinogen-III synthase [Thermoanaerobaculia bacterium]